MDVDVDVDIDEDMGVQLWRESLHMKSHQLIVNLKKSTLEECRVFLGKFRGEILASFDGFVVQFKSLADSNDALERVNADPRAPCFLVKPVAETPTQIESNEELKVFEEFPIEILEDFMKNLLPKVAYHDNTEMPCLDNEQVTFRLTGELQDSLMATDRCNHCGLLSNSTCSQCGAFYCNPDCQRRHWPQHVEECTYMNPSPSTPSDKCSKSPAPTSWTGKRAYLVGYRDAVEIHIRLCTQEEHFVKLMNDVAEEAANCDYLRSTPNEGDHVMVKDHDEDLWYRGQVRVVDYEHDFVVVRLPDRGTDMRVHWRNLKTFGDQFLIQQPSSMLTCHLGGSQQTAAAPELSFKAEQILNNIIDNQLELVLKNDDLQNLCAYVSDLGNSLNSLLSNALRHEINNYQKPILKTTLPAVKLTSHRNVEMLVTDHSDLLRTHIVQMATVEDFIRTYRYNTQFQGYAEQSKGEGYAPITDEVVLVRMTDDENANKWRWFRAVGVVNRGDGSPVVELIDYGFLAKIPLRYIRKMPESLLYPPSGQLFKISDPSDHKKEKSKVLLHFLKDPLFRVIIPAIEEQEESADLPSVYCPDLVAQMNS